MVPSSFLFFQLWVFSSLRCGRQTKLQYSPSANQRSKACSAPCVLPWFSITGSNWLLHIAVLSCTVDEWMSWNHSYALDEYQIHKLNTVTVSGTLGYTGQVAVSNKVLVRPDITLCAGLVSIDLVGVFLWSSRANHRSLLSLGVVSIANSTFLFAL